MQSVVTMGKRGLRRAVRGARARAVRQAVDVRRTRSIRAVRSAARHRRCSSRRSATTSSTSTGSGRARSPGWTRFFGSGAHPVHAAVRRAGLVRARSRTTSATARASRTWPCCSLTLSFGLMFYLNFKYGYSYADTRRRRGEARRCASATTSSSSASRSGACGPGIGLARCGSGWRSKLPERRRAPDAATAGSLLAAPLLAIALIPLALNWRWAARAQRLRRARLGVQPADERRAVRRALHERRQRHLPALVRAGSRRHSPGRHGHRDELPEHARGTRSSCAT